MRSAYMSTTSDWLNETIGLWGATIVHMVVPIIVVFVHLLPYWYALSYA